MRQLCKPLDANPTRSRRGLDNFRKFSQTSSCLEEAMSTRKKCSIAFINYCLKVRANLNVTYNRVYILSSKHSYQQMTARALAQLFYNGRYAHWFSLDFHSRIIMLETIAGVPGMIGAMTRHFHALRRLTRDNGWMHTLLGKPRNHVNPLYFHVRSAISLRLGRSLLFHDYLDKEIKGEKSKKKTRKRTENGVTAATVY